MEFSGVGLHNLFELFQQSIQVAWAMSYTERHEEIKKSDWMNRLEGVRVQRGDMNKIIMNYLVTGRHTSACPFHIM